MSSLERFLAFDAAPFLPGGRLPSPVARAVKAGERVFLSGSGAQKSDGSIAGLGDPAAQAEAALDNIEAALVGAGWKARGHHQADDLHRRSRPSQACLRGHRPALEGRVPGEHGPRGRRPPHGRADGADRRRCGDRLSRPTHPQLRDEELVRPGHRLARLDDRGRRERALHPRPDGIRPRRQPYGGSRAGSPRMRRRRPSSR